MIVVDAGVLATALADDGADGGMCRGRLRNETLAAPYLIDLEVLSVIRCLTLAGALPIRRAHLAIDDLSALPLDRVPHDGLIARCLELRENLTPYDAAYVAIAETLHVPFLTADKSLARSPGLRCQIELLNSN